MHRIPFIINTFEEHQKYYNLAIDIINRYKNDKNDKIVKDEIIKEPKINPSYNHKNQKSNISIPYLNKIKNPTFEQCCMAINRDAFEIKEIKIQTPELCKLAITNNPFSIKHIKTKYLTNDLCQLAISLNWKSIQFIKNPNSIIIEYAIKQNACSIKYIKNLGREFYEMAIKNYSSVIQYISKDLEYYYSLCKLAVSVHGSSIQYIENQTIELCEIAINTHPHSLKYIKIQTIDLCEKAIDKDWNSFIHIQNKTFYLCNYVMNKTGYALKLIPEKYFDRFQKKAVKQTGKSIQYIPNPSTKIIDYALNDDGNAIIYVPKTPENIIKAINSLTVPNHLSVEYLEMVSNKDIYNYYEKNAKSNLNFLRYFDLEIFKKLDFSEYKPFEKFNIIEEFIIELFIISFTNFSNILSKIDYSLTDDKFQNYIIELDIENIKYITNPSYDVCLNVINKSNFNIKYINNAPKEIYDILIQNIELKIICPSIYSYFPEIHYKVKALFECKYDDINSSTLNFIFIPKECYTLDVCKQLIKCSYSYFKYFPKEVMKELDYIDIIKKNPEYIEYLPEELLTKEIIYECIEKNSKLIHNLYKKYINKELIMLAFNNKCYDALKYLDEKLTLNEWKNIIHTYASSIKYINSKFTETEINELYLIAVKKYGNSIKYITNQTIELQENAVKRHLDAFKYLINPSEQITMDTINNNCRNYVDILVYIENITSKILLSAINHGRCIECIYFKNIIKNIHIYDFSINEIDVIFDNILNHSTKYPYLKYYKKLEKYFIANSFIDTINKYKTSNTTSIIYTLINYAIDGISNIYINCKYEKVLKSNILNYKYIVDIVPKKNKYELLKFAVNNIQHINGIPIHHQLNQLIYLYNDELSNENLYEFYKIIIKKHGGFFGYIPEDFITEDIQIIAIIHNFDNIRLIQNPSKKICLLALNYNSSAIHYIKNQTYSLWNDILKQNPLLLFKFNMFSVINDNKNITELDLYNTFADSIKNYKKSYFDINFINYKFPNYLPLNLYEKIIFNCPELIKNVNWNDINADLIFYKKIFKINKNIIKYIDKYNILNLIENKIKINSNDNMSFDLDDDNNILCPICCNIENKYFVSYDCNSNTKHIICLDCSQKYDKCYFCRNNKITYDIMYIKD